MGGADTGRVEAPADLTLALIPLAVAAGLHLRATRRRDRRPLVDGIAEAHSRLDRAIESSPAGVVQLDLGGRFTHVNRTYAEMLGRKPEQLLLTTISDVTHPDDAAAERSALGRLITGRFGSYRAERRQIRGDGSTAWVLLNAALVVSEQGEPLHFHIQVQDVTDRVEVVDRLDRAARTDELTGLANRDAWERALGREIARAGRSREPLSVALLDIDGLARFNDTHGREAGDDLLRELAIAWRAVIRETDLLARHGGQQFAILLPDCAGANARAVVDRVRGVTAHAPVCSAGVVEWDGSEDAPGLLGRAHDALVDAKAERPFARVA